MNLFGRTEIAGVEMKGALVTLGLSLTGCLCWMNGKACRWRAQKGSLLIFLNGATKLTYCFLFFFFFQLQHYSIAKMTVPEEWKQESIFLCPRPGSSGHFLLFFSAWSSRISKRLDAWTSRWWKCCGLSVQSLGTKALLKTWFVFSISCSLGCDPKWDSSGWWGSGRELFWQVLMWLYSSRNLLFSSNKRSFTVLIWSCYHPSWISYEPLKPKLRQELEPPHRKLGRTNQQLCWVWLTISLEHDSLVSEVSKHSGCTICFCVAALLLWLQKLHPQHLDLQGHSSLSGKPGSTPGAFCNPPESRKVLFWNKRPCKLASDDFS